MALCPSGHESQTSDYCDTCGALMGGAPITPSAVPGPASSAAPAPDPGARASGQVCPYCQTARSGRFCEEDGYDFELAELLPPGSAPPAAPPQPDPPLTPPPVTPPAVTPQPEASDPLAKTAVLAPEGEPGLDLEAELAAAERAAAERAAVKAAPVSPDLGTAVAAVVHADQDYYNAQVQRGDIVEADFPFPRYPGERRFALDADRVRIGRASASRGIVVEIDLTGPPLDPAVSHLHAQLLRVGDGAWSLVDLNSANGTRLNGAEDPIPAETEVPVKAGDRIHLGVWTTITLEES
ncbi:MAG TPA: FHA domain-containing protein [Actinocrinis sp.]|nr:FHA domain-containing protein [Actinocrinis sp.]